MKRALRMFLTAALAAVFIFSAYGQRQPPAQPPGPPNPAETLPPHPPMMPPMGHHERGEGMPYRGRRMTDEQYDHGRNAAFFAERISIKKIDKWLIINIVFSLPLDPLAVDTSAIHLNGKKLDAQTVVKFGRMGNLLQLLVPAHSVAGAENPEQTFDLLLAGIVGFNGTPLEERQYNGIRRERVYVFTE